MFLFVPQPQSGDFRAKEALPVVCVCVCVCVLDEKVMMMVMMKRVAGEEKAGKEKNCHGKEKPLSITCEMIQVHAAVAVNTMMKRP